MCKPITNNELMNYLGFDFADDMITANLNRAIDTADMYLRGALGEDYSMADSRAKELALIIAADLYDNRGVNEQSGGSHGISNNMRKLVYDMCEQIRCEMRRKSQNEGL